MLQKGAEGCMIRESEVKLEHAINSVTLHYAIRTVLASEPQNRVEWVQKVRSLVNLISETLKNTPEVHIPIEWKIMTSGIHVLISQMTCLEIAYGGDGNLVEERMKCEVFISDLSRLLSSSALKLHQSTDSILQTIAHAGQFDFDELRSFLILIPLPTLYWYSRELVRAYQYTTTEQSVTSMPLLRVIVFLDHSPLSSPQLLKSNIVYPILFRIRGLVWPKDATRLGLDLLTTCPASVYSVSQFTLDSSNCASSAEYGGDISGQIVFNSAQSGLLDDLIFTVRAAFEYSDGSLKEITVIGHNEICLRVIDEDSHPLITGNRLLDRHIEELVTKLLRQSPRTREELPDLLSMLQALTRLLATYVQAAIYKGRNDVSEAEFQITVLRDLRLILGQEVQEHPQQAGGITDIRYRGVIVELKVEKENGDREHISRKYTSQPVQYAGVEARQVSILMVLDLTSKDKPPGDIRNDIILTDVETHGGQEKSKKFPSKAFVFVINGNMKSPSTYSR